MANIVCYNSDGSILRYYTQWDTDQKLIIKGADISSAPVFHFLNAYKNIAYVVQSEIDETSIVANVPDILLQNDLPLIVYIYYESGTTEYSIRIPVMPRKKPSDYVYVDTGTGGGGSSITNIIIANDLTTDDPKAALSAAQGVVIKSQIETLDKEKLEESDIVESINTALSIAKESGDFKGDSGKDGNDGRGIRSILLTDGNGAAGTTDIYTITYTDDTTSTFNVYNGANGVSTGGGSAGTGANGATFTPIVDQEGNLSWRNDQGLANPAPVNIKGPAGSDGKNGVSPTVYVTEDTDGQVITITDINGSTVVHVKNGRDGTDGNHGTTPQRGTDYWTLEDRAQIINDVLNALPVWTGGIY